MFKIVAKLKDDSHELHLMHAENQIFFALHSSSTAAAFLKRINEDLKTLTQVTTKLEKMNNQINPKVKLVWNVYMLYTFGGWVVINTTAYHLCQYNLHASIKELHDLPYEFVPLRNFNKMASHRTTKESDILTQFFFKNLLFSIFCFTIHLTNLTDK